MTKQHALQDYFASHGERLSQSQRVALEDFALWMDDARSVAEPRDDAEFLSLVGHCSNCSCQDCREFFKADARARAEPAGGCIHCGGEHE